MFFMFVAEGILRILPGSDLGPRTSRIQVHSMQTASTQKMPQSGAQAVPESAAATAAAAERGVPDDRQKW